MNAFVLSGGGNLGSIQAGMLETLLAASSRGYSVPTFLSARRSERRTQPFSLSIHQWTGASLV